MNTFNKFFPLLKVDVARREVSGILTDETPDKSDEICDYASTKPYYVEWSGEFQKATGGKSLGNIREMHKLIAAGKLTHIEYDDANKRIIGTAKVVDDDAWKKCEEGVYTGFSHGGEYVPGSTKQEGKYKRYTAKPSEVSLVDNPCNPAAHFTYVKADGSEELRKFKAASPAPEGEAVAAAAKDASLPPDGQVDAVDTATDLKKQPTKKVAGEDLPASAFLFASDLGKTETWRLPVEFKEPSMTKAHVQRALAMFGQVEAPQEAKDAAWQRLQRAAGAAGVDVEAITAATLDVLVKRLMQRAEAPQEQVEQVLAKMFASEPLAMTKSMNDVAQLARLLLQLAYLRLSAVNEAKMENDTATTLPADLQADLENLADTFLTMAQEETKELVTATANISAAADTNNTQLAAAGVYSGCCPAPACTCGAPTTDLVKAVEDELSKGAAGSGRTPGAKTDVQAQVDHHNSRAQHYRGIAQMHEDAKDTATEAEMRWHDTSSKLANAFADRHEAVANQLKGSAEKTVAAPDLYKASEDDSACGACDDDCCSCTDPDCDGSCCEDCPGNVELELSAGAVDIDLFKASDDAPEGLYLASQD